jgi:hypothetical protein
MLHPPSRWGKGVTAVLFAYMDGSGTHAGSRIVAIGGFVADESDWLAFDERWNEVLDDKQWPSRLSEFHMVDCAHGDGEFFDGRWHYAQRLALYGDLCGVILKSNLRPIAASVVAECLQQIPSSDLALLQEERNRLGTPLDLCFHSLVQNLLGAVHDRNPEETVSVLFDKDNKDKEEKFSDFCNNYGRDYFQGESFAGYGFGDSKSFTPIQAADLLAFGTFHLGHVYHYPSEAEPHFPVVPAFWKLLVGLAGSPTTSPYGTIITLESVQKFVADIKAGRMLPKRRRNENENS